MPSVKFHALNLPIPKPKKRGFTVKNEGFYDCYVTACKPGDDCDGCGKKAHKSELQANACLIRMFKERIAHLRKEIEQAEYTRARLQAREK